MSALISSKAISYRGLKKGYTPPAQLTMYVGPESPVRVYCSVSTTSIPEALLRSVASGCGFPTLCALGMLMALGVLQGVWVRLMEMPRLVLNVLQPQKTIPQHKVR